MDIGDLLFLAMIGIGILSSMFGKKPAPKGQRPAPKPRPRERPDGRSVATLNRSEEEVAPPTPATPGRSEVLSHMEQILQELQLAPPGAAEPAAVKPAPEIELDGEIVRVEAPPTPPPPLRRPTPPKPPARQPVSAVPVPVPDAPLEQIPVDYTAYRAREHREFHDRYVVHAPRRGHRSSASRVRRFLDQHGLRGAVLASEILGPPKGLQ